MNPVLLVNMPFSSLGWPALGISLLQARLRQRGIGCDSVYFNFDLAEMLGLDLYTWVAESFGFVMGGERLFAQVLFSDRLPAEADYVREVLYPADPLLPLEDLRDFWALGEHLGPFLERCLTAVDWNQYRVVGFTTTFQQTLASAALATRLKQAFPHLIICLGGSNCEGAMGRELARQFPQFDYVCEGEGDDAFPAFVSAILQTGELEGTTPGYEGEKINRSGSASDGLPPPAPIDLDSLPYPDFTDYFTRWQQSPLRAQLAPFLLFETARGCWWGAKNQCAFCGLNGAGIAFRSKSTARALAELTHLQQQYAPYQVHRACATDNILDFRYYQTFLPALAAAKLNLDLEYELKTNLSRKQVELLVAAGLRLAELGIETFATRLLKLMRKGVSALQNIQTLKWLTEANVVLKWNFLYGVPGETPADYADLPALLAKLTHLCPPVGVGAVRLDRFSPYFATPAAFGLTNVQPHPAYRHIFPFPTDVLANLAYYFTAEGLPGQPVVRPKGAEAKPVDEAGHAHSPGSDERDMPMSSACAAAMGSAAAAYVRPTLDALAFWQTHAGQGTLRAVPLPEGRLLILDTRPRWSTAYNSGHLKNIFPPRSLEASRSTAREGAFTAVVERRLNALEASVYQACDRARSYAALLAEAREHPAFSGEAALRGLLAEWLEAGIMLYLDDAYLSLALRASG